MKRAVLFVTDENYLPHYQSLAVNVRCEGDYEDDIVWIVPERAPWADDLRRRGFPVIHVQDTGFLAKFHIFTPRLQEYDQVMFIDADCIVQRPLQPLFDQLTHWPRLPDGRKPIISSREETPVLMSWQVHDKDWKEHTATYEEMGRRFPHVMSTDKMWSTCLLIFDPKEISDGTVERLRELQQTYFICNDPAKGGTDEQIIDLLLHDQMAQCAEKAWCYWGLDEQASRVPSAARGWVGGEIPAVAHYTRWYAPWIEKQPGMHAYDNDRVGAVCHQFYRKNLLQFPNIFPVTTGA